MRQWCRRYLWGWTPVCLAVVGFVIFYGDHTIFSSIADDRTVDSLRAVLQAKQDTTEHYRRLNERLQSDRALMEQVVREQYRMKRPHEDVFIMNPEQ